ncbi:MAG: peptide/nickel transport system ATP-binding protein [Actinomycetota bacterium]|jgi:peptide/nickel transport system ATP-binding protein|nr:peptide/nickel transport system ATP-binding protein [Actinomycetota bacterium]
MSPDRIPVLELRDLTVRFGRGRQAFAAVDRVSLSIGERETLGLVGESGCGKSTLARAIVGLVPPDSGGLRIRGEDFAAARGRRLRALRSRVQMVFQDPYSSLNPRMSVEETLKEAATTHARLGRAAAELRVGALLDMVGLPATARRRRPSEFSGGQRQRIAIARALAVGPALLVADEITSALDVSVQANVLNLVKSIQRDAGLAMLFISHNLAVVRHVSDRVAVMHVGRVVEESPARNLFGDPRHPYTQALLDAVPRLHGALSATSLGEAVDPRHPPAGCTYHPRCIRRPNADADGLCTALDPALRAVSASHRAACHYPDVAGPTRLVTETWT